MGANGVWRGDWGIRGQKGSMKGLEGAGDVSGKDWGAGGVCRGVGG